MPKVSTRDRLIRLALDRMLERGFHGVAVDELCRESGVGKGSFYYHFKSKEELGLAALDLYWAEGIKEVFPASLLEIEDPKERAYRMLDNAISISKARWGHGCLLGTLALELTEANPDLRQRTKDLFQTLIHKLAEVYEPFAKPEAQGGPSALEVAEYMTMALEGGIVLAQAFDDAERIPASLCHFRKFLECLEQSN